MPNPKSRRAVARCAALVALLGGSLVLFAGPAAAAAPKTPLADFNGDGYADLAISSPYATVNGVQQAGAVSVVLGSAAGVDTARAHVLTQATEGVPGDVMEYGTFGMNTAARDLDADGYTDLIVGNYYSPMVLWGSAHGLSGAARLPDTTYRVHPGDIDGDGHADLVVPGNDGLEVRFGPFNRAGVPARTATRPVPDEGPQDLTVGDMNGDGKDDVVTTNGFEDMQFDSRYYKGTSSGLSSTYKSTGYYTVGGVVADVNQDGYGDFVTRQVDQVSEMKEYDAGAVRVVYGSANGPSTRTSRITQNTTGVPGTDEAGYRNQDENDYGDQFGYALAAGDVTGDGYPDIAVGVPGEDVGSARDTGAVVLLKGGPTGLTGSGAQAFNQSTSGVPGAAEAGDNFGRAVLLTDVNTNNRADLVVGAPLEDSTHENSGALWVLRGSKTGLTTANIASFGPAALGAPEKGSFFGMRLAR